MPKALEKKLWAEVNARSHTAHPIKHPDAYVYGTLRKTGWEPGQERVRKQKRDRYGRFA